MNLGNVLIFGDSYSTYEGYIPDGYAIYYYNDARHNDEVHSVNETWWHRVITETGSKLLLNDSWSGSAICHTGGGGSDCSETSSFVCRFNKMKDSGFFEKNKVDTVFVFGGTNDAGVEAPLGEAQYDNFEKADLFKVLPAISYLLRSLKETLPEANIYCLINDGYLGEVITAGLKDSSEKFGAKAIALENIEKKNGHPTTAGMAEIARQVLEYIGK